VSQTHLIGFSDRANTFISGIPWNAPTLLAEFRDFTGFHYPRKPKGHSKSAKSLAGEAFVMSREKCRVETEYRNFAGFPTGPAAFLAA
jgi:hypothetical protein